MSIELLKHLDALSPSQRMRWWGNKQPWTYQGKSIRLSRPASMTFRDVKVDASGNVHWMSRPVLRPCFGMPTAFLMHGGESYRRGPNGRSYPSRCTSCPAQGACEYVAKARLRVPGAIRSAHDAWEAAGGKKALDADRGLGGGLAMHRYVDLMRSLDAHGAFGSVNDDSIKSHVLAEGARQLAADAERKKKARRRDRVANLESGVIDDRLIARLQQESAHREALFEKASRDPKPPRWVGAGDASTPRFTATVWRLLTIAQLSGQIINPSHIASHLIEGGLVSTTNQNALRDKVRVTLHRIHRLETVVLSGRERPIWPRLTRRDLLTDPNLEDDPNPIR